MKVAMICDLHKTLMDKDETINLGVFYKIEQQKSNGVAIIIVSRDHSEQDKSIVMDWLKEHGVSYDKFFVSPADMIDEKQVKVKEYILNQKIKGKYHVILAIDDKKSVRKMYEEHGIETINPKDL
jgi:hypothetical protein